MAQTKVSFMLHCAVFSTKLHSHDIYNISACIGSLRSALTVQPRTLSVLRVSAVFGIHVLFIVGNVLLCLFLLGSIKIREQLILFDHIYSIYMGLLWK